MKYKLSLLILLFTAINGAFAQKLYNIDKIQNIELQFAFTDWDAKMDAAAASAADGYTVALWCKINGEQFDSVGVKFKGNSSYKASNAKNPLHIELNYIKSQDYKGYTDLKLSNGFSDPSFVREALSFQIIRDYMDAPDANFANVWINGKKYGFFTNVQNVNKVFLKDHFDENNGTFVKCTPAAGAGGGGGSTGYCTLKYLGADSSLYKSKYDMKTVGGFKDLIGLCDTVTNKSAEIHKVIDVNRSLWMLAFNNLLSNYDSYTGAFAQNYYLYKDKTNRFLPIVWDLNMSFGGFNIGSTPGSDLSKTVLYYQNTNADRPLIKNLLSNPTYKKMYVAHIKTMIEDWFANGKYLTVGNELQAIADTAFNNDPNKLYTYANFKKGLTTAISGGMGSTPGIKPLMDSRLTFYNTQADFTAKTPTIATLDAVNAQLGKSANVSLTVTDATAVSFFYRFAKNDRFQSISLFDDGNHNDGTANDGKWGGDFVMAKTECQYYIYAENASAGIFSPRQAEHVFHTFYTTEANTIAAGEVVVNEIMANNKATVQSPSGKYADWVELYNTTSKDIDLSNAGLTDNYSTPKKWTFPVGTTIKAKDYLVVWADDADTGTGLHAAFKLADNGERILLTDPNGTYLDSLSFDNQKADLSYARCPNATGAFVITNPTFGVSNGNCMAVTATDDALVLTDLSVFPNPTNSILNMKNENRPLGNVYFYDVTGKVLMHTKFNTNEAQLDLSNFSKGLYFLKAEGSRVVKVALVD